MRNRDHYPENWVDTIRPRILLRDNYECQICKIQHRAQRPDTGKKVFLQISHKDHHTASHEDDNLWALCDRCHLDYDREFNTILRKSQLRNG